MDAPCNSTRSIEAQPPVEKPEPVPYKELVTCHLKNCAELEQAKRDIVNLKRDVALYKYMLQF